MKMRTHFVSNSSSTSYIIAITKDFQFTEEEIDWLFQEHSVYGDCVEPRKEDYVDMLNNFLEDLKNDGKGWVWSEESDLSFYDLKKVLKKRKILLSEIESGADNGDHIVNILSDENVEKLKELIR